MDERAARVDDGGRRDACCTKLWHADRDTRKTRDRDESDDEFRHYRQWMPRSVGDGNGQYGCRRRNGRNLGLEQSPRAETGNAGTLTNNQRLQVTSIKMISASCP